MLTHTEVISRKEVKTYFGNRVDIHSITYKLNNRPFRLYSRWELPKSYKLEDYETEEDSWFRKDGHLYNLNEFCRIGMPHLPGPRGGAQLASNGYFAIAGFDGSIYSVDIQESKPI